MFKSIKASRNLLTAVFIALFMLCFSVTANAATKEPFGFTYEDSANGRTVYLFHVYSEKNGAYISFREFYSKGVYVYSSGGVLICNTSAGSGSRYQGYDSEGNFYILGNDGSVTVVSTTNKTSVLLKSGAIKLNYNGNDVATTVSTTSGTKYLSNLALAPEIDDNTYVPAPTVKAANRVEIYTNSANELVYEAYKNNKVKTKIVVSSNGKSVLNATDSVRLTDTLLGAKFLGFDSSYNVYLYESDSLYRFKAGNWYSAEKLSLAGKYQKFEKSDSGFIQKVVTTKNSYTIKQLTTSEKWKAKKTYTVTKKGYITLYIKGSTKTNTLTLKSSKLSLNGKKIATGVSKYGFINAKKIIYLKGKNVYSALLSNPKKTTRLYTNAKSFKNNSLGLVTKVVTAKGSKKVS